MSADIGAIVKRNDTPCIQVSCFNQSVLALVKEVTYISVSDFVIITNLYDLMVWNLAVFCHLYATSLRFYIFLAYLLSEFLLRRI